MKSLASSLDFFNSFEVTFTQSISPTNTTSNRNEDNYQLNE